MTSKERGEREAFLKMSLSKDHKKVFECVGRFFHSFGVVEGWIDEVIGILFNLDEFSKALLKGNLDFQKKKNLLQYGLKESGIDMGRSLERIDHFKHLRNALAHSTEFHPAYDGKRVVGANFYWVRQSGETKLPGRGKAREKSDDFLISFSEFDEYDRQMREICWELMNAGVEPVNKGANFAKDISAMIASSDNVFLFKKPPL